MLDQLKKIINVERPDWDVRLGGVDFTGNSYLFVKIPGVKSASILYSQGKVYGSWQLFGEELGDRPANVWMKLRDYLES